MTLCIFYNEDSIIGFISTVKREIKGQFSQICCHNSLWSRIAIQCLYNLLIKHFLKKSVTMNSILNLNKKLLSINPRIKNYIFSWNYPFMKSLTKNHIKKVNNYNQLFFSLFFNWTNSTSKSKYCIFVRHLGTKTFRK